MDKQREEFEKCYPLAVWDAELQGYTEEQYTYALVGWRQAHAELLPEIDRLASDKDELNDLAEKQEQQLSAANQRNKELQSENETCRNLMRIKQEQNDAFSQRITELLDLVEVVERHNKQLEERIRVADAEIKRLQGWVDVLEKPKVWSQAEIEAIKGSGLEYSMYLAEESLLVHRVVEEVQALRRGVGVSYAINDDPVEKLAKKLPPVENVVSTLAMIKAAMQKQLLKEK